MNVYRYVNNLRSIPKYIRKLIEQTDKLNYPQPYTYLRFYSYLTVWRKHNELVKITVAVKHYRRKLYMKQVAVHLLHCAKCFVKDMEYNYYSAMGFRVGWHSEGIQKYQTWYESEHWGYADDKYYDPFAPIVNLEVIDRFPQYKYSAYKQYGGVNILKYLRYYEKYPQTEMLVKFGLSAYVFSVQIQRKISSDKAFRKWLVTNRVEIANRQYYVATILRAYKTGKTLDHTQTLLHDKKTFTRDSRFNALRRFFKGRLDVFLEYIERQNTNFYSYLNYFDACNSLNIDMTLERNVFPHDFKRWHDIRIDEYHTARALKDAAERKTLYDRFQAVANKYLALQRDMNESFVVVIAKSPAELIREGDVLHHCVGRMNYDQRIIREESLIFFVRNVNAPAVPFVTLEYSIKSQKVLQCYGEHDHKPDASVLEFVNNKWLPYANRKLKQIAA